MGEAYGERDELIEDSGLELQPEEFRIMRKQSRVQVPLDSRQIKCVVL